MRGSRSDLVLAVASAAVLAVTFVVPWRLHALIVAGATLIGVAAVYWERNRHEILSQRIGTAFITGAIGFAAAFFLVAEAGAVTFVLGAAILLLCTAALERTRLRGAEVPAEGEASGRVAFEGTVHAIGEPSRVPGTEREVVVWHARQGSKRWTSSARFEIRSAARRVLVEPRPARVRGTAVVMSGHVGQAAADALGGETSLRRELLDPVRLWSFDEGDPVYVVGGATLEDDPAAPTLRDPARISVFTKSPVVGPGRLADVRRAAEIRVWLWSAVALAAGGLMAAGLAGLG